MAKKTGAFNYINLCLEEGNLAAITKWKAKLLASKSKELDGAITARNYYVLYNPQAQLEPNTFNDLDYRLADERHHLTFYESSYTELAENIHHRNLSYAHGTEYFEPKIMSKTNQKITVHYHFNAFGAYTHTTAKREDGSAIEFSVEQKMVCRERAKEYGIVLENILDKKRQKYIELSEEIERVQNNIMQAFESEKINKNYIEKQITQCIKLYNLKENIGDKRFDRSTSMRAFVNAIKKRMDGSLQASATQKEPIKLKEESLTKSINQVQQPVTAEQTSVTLIDPDKVRQDLMEKQVAQFTKDLRELTNIYAVINQQTSQQDLANYLQKVNALRIDLALLSFDEPTKKIAKNINNLFEKINALKSADQILLEAIKNLHLEHIKATLDFCEHKAINQAFKIIIERWLAYENRNDGMDDKYQAITDFFYEASDNFSCFITSFSLMVTYSFDRSSSYSILRKAMDLDNKKLFNALLSYGADPSVPFASVDGTVFNGPLYMLLSKCLDSFYIEKLIAYGLDFNNLNEYMSKDEFQAMKSSSSLGRRQASKTIQHAKNTLAEFGYSANTVYLESNDKQQEAKVCPFVQANVWYSSYIDESALAWYAIYAENCSLSSLLISAAWIIQRNGLQVDVMAGNNPNKLILNVESTVEDLNKNFKSFYDEQLATLKNSEPKSLSYIISSTFTDILDLKKLKIIVDNINTRFPRSLSPADLNIESSKITKIQERFNVEDHSLIFMALGFLCGFQYPLGEKVMIFCIKNLFKGAKNKLEYSKVKIKKMLPGAENPNKDNIAQIMQQCARIKNEYMYILFNYFKLVIEAAYFAPSLNNIELPEIKSSFDEIEAICANLKPPYKDIAGQLKKTPTEWLSLRNGVSPAKQDTIQGQDQSQEQEEITNTNSTTRRAPNF